MLAPESKFESRSGASSTRRGAKPLKVASLKTAPLKASPLKVSPLKNAASASTDEIYQRILTAILEHRLKPGTQLLEERLAAIFNVSRTKIREATGRLVHDRIATNFPNRGTFITRPTADDARDIFAARRLIEPGLAREATMNATPKQINALRAHLAREAKVRATNDVYALVPITGEFHMMLAEMAGNHFLLRTLRELESLTCLCIVLYDVTGNQSCRVDEHDELLDAIVARDGDKAASLMLHHLHHIEAGLNLSPHVDAETALEDAFK